MKIRRRCKCGCGGITNYGKIWIHSHHPKMKDKKHSKETKDKMRLSHVGKENSEEARRKLSLFNTGKILSEETKKKLSLVNIGKELSKETKKKMSIAKQNMSKETKRKISLAVQNMSDETKRKISRNSKNNWQDPVFQKKQYDARAMSPNKPEQFLMNLLDKLFPNEYKYVGDFQFWLGGKNPDFMNVNGQKKLIELYGDYWHKGQDPQDRINHFKQYGFNTLVIWENELKESRLNLRRKLKNFQRKGDF